MLKIVFEWLGKPDPATLEQIAQIPAICGVFCKLSSLCGDGALREEELSNLRGKIACSGLALEVVEYFPLHEDVIRMKGDHKRHIANFKEDIARLSEIGVKCLCYSLDLCNGNQRYGEHGEAERWKNMEYFLGEIIPVAEKYRVNMALCPNGRAQTFSKAPGFEAAEKDIDALLGLRHERIHGIALPISGLGLENFESRRKLVRKYGAMGRIHFTDLGNPQNPGESNAKDIPQLMKAYHDADFEGYATLARRGANPGAISPDMELRGVALGANYLAGVWDTLDKFNF
ncbi:MAG: mannonate dehydratase [Synergistaceae bacterium]|jgi:mannonate dehydratase|nr:mannonate dehydratase [Synergistaceae bacterium]